MRPHIHGRIKDGTKIVNGLTGLSDHNSILFTLDIPRQPPCITKTTGRNYKQLDLDAFREDLANALESITEVTADDLLQCYADTVASCLDRQIPVTARKRGSQKRCPWYNGDVHNMRQAKKRAERRWRRTLLEVDRQIYLEARDASNRCVAMSKMAYFSQMFVDADQRDASMTLNRLLKVDTVQLPESESTVKLCNDFANFFNNKIETIRGKIAERVKGEDLITPSSGPVAAPPPLSELRPTDRVELTKIIMKSPNKTCSLDVLPTTLLKQTLDIQIPTLVNIINMSFASGSFPRQLKTAVVKPLLKRPSLDKNNLQNYRPVSNLAYIGKVMEKVAVRRLVDHLEMHGLEEKLQSAYRHNHCTETALMKIHNEVGCAIDHGQGALLLFLDMSAAFDTVEVTLLRDILQTHIGLEGAALSWFLSYITDRSQQVVIAGEYSREVPLRYGVPQGSVLGPVLFSIYTLPLQVIFERHRVMYHKYADDTTIYTFYNPALPGDLDAAHSRLVACFDEVRAWLLTHRLQLNDAKTEFLCVLSPHHLREHGRDAIRLGDVTIAPADTVRSLGVVLDTHFNMTAQVNAVIRSCSHHIRQIGRIRKYISTEACHSAVQSLVVSRLDYCNALLTGLPHCQMQRLQRLQNRAARLVTLSRKFSHVTPLLKELHWLPVRLRVKFKLLLYVYKALHDEAPAYVKDMLDLQVPTRTLRSGSNGPQLTVPQAKKVFGDRTFSSEAPRLWNSLPKHIKLASTKQRFKTMVKTRLFLEYFGDP